MVRKNFTESFFYDSIKKYDIVYAPFSHSDEIGAYTDRPCLCVAKLRYKCLRLVPISTKIAKAYGLSDFLILKSDIGFAQTKLDYDSVIRLDIQNTVSINLIWEKFGSLPSCYHEEIDSILKKS